MQRQDGLDALDGRTNRGRPDGSKGPAARLDIEVLVQRRGLVQAAPVWRRVEVEDRPRRVGDLREDLLQAPAKLVLGQLAERVPRRRVRPSVGEHLEAVQLEGVVAAEFDKVPALQARVDLEHVVVRRGDDRADPLARQAVVGHGDPALGPLEHHLLEPLVDRVLVVLHVAVLLLGDADRVVAAVQDLRLDVADLVLGLQGDVLVEHRGVPAGAALDDGDHGLAGDVAADDHDVGAVVGARVQELPPADLGAVDVRDVEDLGHRSPRSMLFRRDVPPARGRVQVGGCRIGNTGALTGPGVDRTRPARERGASRPGSGRLPSRPPSSPVRRCSRSSRRA